MDAAEHEDAGRQSQPPTPVDSDGTDDQAATDEEPSDEEPSDEEPSEKAAKKKAKKKAQKKTEWRLFKWLRVAIYAACVLLVALALVVQRSYSNFKHNALDVGDELGKLGDVGNKLPIVLNGQRIHVASSLHQLSVTETLDQAESLCEAGAVIPWGADPDQMAAPVPGDTGEQPLDTDEAPPARWLMREEEDHRGVVLCFAPPEGQTGEDSFSNKANSVMRFLKSGDLNEIGRMRYLYARETDTPGRSQLIAVWTDGPFNFYAMSRQPGGGDAPGSDPDDAPRPPDSVRLLSATVDVAPYAVRVYETQKSTADIAAAYDRDMPERGWKLVIPDGDSRVYQKDQITVFVTPTVHEGRVMVSMLHMGSDMESD